MLIELLLKYIRVTKNGAKHDMTTEIESLRVTVKYISDAQLVDDLRFASAMALSERYSEAFAAKARREVYLDEMGYRAAREFAARYAV